MLNEEEQQRKQQLLDEIKALEDNARQRWSNEAQARRYSFAEVIQPGVRKDIEAFQEIFGRYIPELLDDEHATIVLHSRMTSSIFGNPTDTISHATFDADLKRLRKAIQVIAEHPLGYWQQFSYLTFKSDPENAVDRGARELFDVIMNIQAFNDDKMLPSILHRYEEWAREAASSVPDKRNINWEAVHAVGCLRGFWEGWTDTAAPRALNPQSPFALYLYDAFQFFGIEGDPISAFRRWAALADENEGWL